MHRTLLAALAVLAALSAAPAGAAARTETERYTGSGVVTLGQSRSGCPADIVNEEENLGEVCFHLDGDAGVTIAIDDDVTPNVQGYYVVWSGTAILRSEFFCDGVTVPLGEDATAIEVSVGEAVNQFCALETGTAHAAVSGTVTASFS